MVGKTNLPDDLEVVLIWQRGGFSEPRKVEVHSRQFTADCFTLGNGSAFLRGATYGVNFVGLHSFFQPPKVQAAIGAHDERLPGPWVTSVQPPTYYAVHLHKYIEIR